MNAMGGRAVAFLAFLIGLADQGRSRARRRET